MMLYIASVQTFTFSGTRDNNGVLMQITDESHEKASIGF